MACQDWASTKAAYRFLSKECVHEHVILEGHFLSTRERFGATAGPMLILHDTTMFSFQRNHHDLIGITNKVYAGKDKDGRHTSRAQCGIQMHSSLAVIPEGMPLGLAAV